MKPAFVLVPLLLPRLPDRAAAQLLDFLEQRLGCIRHHYAPQLERRQRRQRRLDRYVFTGYAASRSDPTRRDLPSILK